MEHLILTETDFFRLIDNPGSTGLGTAYNEFTTTVVSLCKERESVCRTVFALSYAETELQYHDAMQETDSIRSMYVRKALSFVRKMLKYYQVRLHRGGAFDGGGSGKTTDKGFGEALQVVQQVWERCPDPDRTQLQCGSRNSARIWKTSEKPSGEKAGSR